MTCADTVGRLALHVEGRFVTTLSAPQPEGTKIRVLVADDDDAFRALIIEILSAVPDMTVVGEARDGNEAVESALALCPDVITMDVSMPGCSGIEATLQLVPRLADTRVVMFSAHQDREIVLDVVKAGAHGFIVKGDSVADVIRAVRAAAAGRPILSDKVTAPILEELVTLYQSERKRTAELEEMINSTIRTLAEVLQKRDEGTGDHSKRVVQLATSILRQLDPTAADDKAVERGFLLHDLGKVHVPDAVLLKPGPLTADEWRFMRLHPAAGAEIIKRLPQHLHGAIPIVRHHHERFDGKGYPDGLAGDEIPLACRAFAITDTFDAITSDRPYRSALSQEQAIEEIAANAGTQFDPDAVAVFLSLVGA